MDQLLALITHHGDDVMCLTDTRLSKKASKSYDKTVRDDLGPNAVICASVYLHVIQTVFRRWRKQPKVVKKVGGLMFIINNTWDDKLLNFKIDPTGLGNLASL